MGYANFSKVVVSKECAVLWPEEVNALMAVFDALLERSGLAAARGCFVLDGQQYGDVMVERIVDATLAQGDFRSPMSTGYQQVCDSLYEVEKWPDHDSRFWQQFSNNFMEISGQHYPESGIYQEEELTALVLNAMHGHFLASLKLQSGGVDLAVESCEILRALAVAISCLSPFDNTLQFCAIDVAPEETPLVQYVRQVFEDGGLTEVAAWKKWAEASIKKSIFFTLP